MATKKSCQAKQIWLYSMCLFFKNPDFHIRALYQRPENLFDFFGKYIVHTWFCFIRIRFFRFHRKMLAKLFKTKMQIVIVQIEKEWLLAIYEISFVVSASLVSNIFMYLMANIVSGMLHKPFNIQHIESVFFCSSIAEICKIVCCSDDKNRKKKNRVENMQLWTIGRQHMVYEWGSSVFGYRVLKHSTYINRRKVIFLSSIFYLTPLRWQKTSFPSFSVVCVSCFSLPFSFFLHISNYVNCYFWLKLSLLNVL